MVFNGYKITGGCMKKMFVSLLGFSILFTQSIFAEEVDFDSLRNKLLEKNPQILSAEKAIESKRHSLSITEKGKRPTLNMSQGMSYNHDSSSRNYSTGFSLRYDPDIRKNIDRSVNISALNIEKDINNLQQKKSQLVYELKETFLRIVKLKENIKVARATLKRRKDDLVLIKLKYEAGKESLQAVSESEANMLEAEYRMIQAQNQLSQAYYDISVLLDNQIEEFEPVYQGIEEKFELDHLIKSAIENDFTLKNLKISEKIIELQEEGDLVEYKKPSFTMNVSNSYSGDSFMEKESLSGSLSMSYPLYDGNKKPDIREKYKYDKIAVKQDIEDTKNSIKRDMYKAYNNYKLTLKKLEVEKKVLESKKEIYSLTKLKYEQGTTDYFFLQQKESELTNAEFSYVSSLYDVRVNLAQIFRKLGRIE